MVSPATLQVIFSEKTLVAAYKQHLLTAQMLPKYTGYAKICSMSQPDLQNVARYYHFSRRWYAEGPDEDWH